MSTTDQQAQTTTNDARLSPSHSPEAHQQAGAAKPPKKLGSSPSLAMACKLIAEFYCTSADRVRLVGVPADAPKAWRVFVGDKLIDSVQVVKARGRFVFQTRAVPAEKPLPLLRFVKTMPAKEIEAGMLVHAHGYLWMVRANEYDPKGNTGNQERQVLRCVSADPACPEGYAESMGLGYGLNDAVPVLPGLRVFPFGCMPEAAQKGYTRPAGAFLGSVEDLYRTHAENGLAAVQSPEIAGMPGFFEFALLGR